MSEIYVVTRYEGIRTGKKNHLVTTDPDEAKEERDDIEMHPEHPAFIQVWEDGTLLYTSRENPKELNR